MRNLTNVEIITISGGESEKQQFDNMDVALTFAGFIAPLLVNKGTFPLGDGNITGIHYINFFWSPAAAVLGLGFSKFLKKADAHFTAYFNPQV